MANIGTFTLNGKTYEGLIKTLTIDVQVVIKPVRKTGEKSPSHRVYFGAMEIGAAWSKVSKGETQRPYLAVTFDDPSFPEPVQARLMANDQMEYDLFWNR